MRQLVHHLVCQRQDLCGYSQFCQAALPGFLCGFSAGIFKGAERQRQVMGFAVQCAINNKKIILQQLQLGLVPYIEAVNLFHLRNDSEMVEEMNLLYTS